MNSDPWWSIPGLWQSGAWPRWRRAPGVHWRLDLGI